MSPEEIRQHFFKFMDEGVMIKVPTNVPGHDYAIADHPSFLALANLPIEVVHEALKDVPRTIRFRCPMSRPGYDHRECTEHELPRVLDEDRLRAMRIVGNDRICFDVAFITSNFCPNAVRDAGLSGWNLI